MSFQFDPEFAAESAVRHALLVAIGRGEETVTVKTADLRLMLNYQTTALVELMEKADLDQEQRAAHQKPRPALVEERRWRWGYSDGVPGTPEYEPPVRICNLCDAIQPRCKCDAALTPHPVAGGDRSIPLSVAKGE